MNEPSEGMKPSSTATAAGSGQMPLPAPLTLFTSMFVHGGFMHLAGNMLYLWVFGDNVEDTLGHLNYLVFYLACGLGAAIGVVGDALRQNTKAQSHKGLAVCCSE